MPPCPVALYGTAPPKFNSPTMKFGNCVCAPLTLKSSSGSPYRKFKRLNPSRRSFTLLEETTSVIPSATFRGADLSGANLAHAKLDGADLTGANLNITSIKGTDLTRVKGLTQGQLDGACGDGETKAPAGLQVKTCS